MPSAVTSNATHRTVVLLRTTEKQRLQRLAREGNVSSSEIMRRCLLAYDGGVEENAAEMQPMMAEMNRALDKALEAVRSARSEIADNMAKIKQLRATGV